MPQAEKQAAQVMQSRLARIWRPNSEAGGMHARSLEWPDTGCSAGKTRFHCSKKGSRETMRSLRTGRVPSGPTTTVSARKVSMRVIHARRGIRLTDMAQLPHMPTRQEY